MSEWISVKDRLPEQRDYGFAKFKGTNKWKRGMFEKATGDLLLTVNSGGHAFVVTGFMADDEWIIDSRFLPPNVIAWMPMPGPYEERRMYER